MLRNKVSLLHRTRSMLAIVFLAFIGQCAIAEETDVDRLISDLASPKFIERQLATESLSAMGLAVLEPVRAATRADDAEVRFRARQILRAIRSDDRQRLINAFIAGIEVESNAELPLWDEYRSIVGGAAGVRELYVQMLESEWAFLDAVSERSDEHVPTLLAQRVLQLEQKLRKRKTIEVGSVAAMMLVACRSEMEIPNLSNLMTLCYRAESFDKVVRTEPAGESLKRMMGQLISRPTGNPYLTQRFHFALHYDLKEGVAAARQVINEQAGIPYLRQYAILVLGKLGEADDLKLVESLLDDKGVVSSHNRINSIRITTQVRDIALAVLILKSKGEFERYGVPKPKMNLSTLIQPTSVGFANDDARDVAIEKWRNREGEAEQDK